MASARFIAVLIRRPSRTVTPKPPLDSRSWSSRASRRASPPPLRTTASTPSSAGARRRLPGRERARGGRRGAVAAGAFAGVSGISFFGPHFGQGAGSSSWPSRGGARLPRRWRSRLDDRARRRAELLERHGGWFHLLARGSPARRRGSSAGATSACCIGTITPVLRSFVAIPAGVFEMPFAPYAVSHRSSAPPSGRSRSPGSATGSARATTGFDHDFRYVEYAIVAGVVLLAAYFVYRWRAKAKVGRMAIPLVDVHAEYEPLIPKLEAAFRGVLDNGAFIRGENYWAFQEEAAAHLGVKRTIGVANGTEALVIALNAMGVGPGDEVICPAFTFYATAEAVVQRGATPVFADIDPDDAQPRRRGRGREGHRPDEGDHPRPSLRAGDGRAPAARARRSGARGRRAGVRRRRRREARDGLDVQLLPDEEPLLSRRRRADRDRRRGARRPHQAPVVPRLEGQDRLRGASATTRASTSSRRRSCGSSCQELDGWNAGRRAAAARYAELGLGDLVEIPQDEPGHVYHLFVCRSPERDRIRAALTEAGIASATYYTTPLHLQPSLRYLGY